MNDMLSNSSILSAYRARTPGSAELAKQAESLFPSGITHDSRHLDPYGIYVQRAQGPHKWDVDGNKYTDFYGGHGALLLGHGHPAVTAAVAEALNEGTHFGASHPRELAWARAVRRLVPAAERVRFTSSGTEATLMAVRLSRAFTGRPVLLRFQGHFHGWHDHMAAGYTSHFDGSATPGVLAEVAAQSILIPPNDIPALKAALARGDIAAAILEPTGSSFGQVPIGADFLRELRRLTEEAGTLLIMDEVVSGFRATKGGAQAAYGVRPDLCSFAKILAGGLPGAAVTGRKDVLDQLDFAVSARTGREKIQHQGTFNANPVSAAAGTAALTVIAETDVSDRAAVTAAALREAVNAVFAEENVGWGMYGTYSGFHTFLGAPGVTVRPGAFVPATQPMPVLKSQPAGLSHKLRLALLVNGVDVNGRIGGFVSATHTADDVAATAGAFREAVQMLKAEGEL